MLIVILAVVARTVFFSRNAFSYLKPRSRGGKVTLIGDGTVALGGHTGCATGGETADDDIVVNVATDNLAIGVVTQTAVGRASA